MIENMHDIKGYVYKPPADGLPYVGVVVMPGRDPYLTPYKTYDEAKADIDAQVLRLKYGVIARSRE